VVAVRCRDGNERTDHPPEASHHRPSQEGNSIRCSAEGTALELQYHPIPSPSIQIDNGGSRLINAVLKNSVCTRATNAHHCSSPYQNTVAMLQCRAVPSARHRIRFTQEVPRTSVESRRRAAGSGPWRHACSVQLQQRPSPSTASPSAVVPTPPKPITPRGRTRALCRWRMPCRAKGARQPARSLFFPVSKSKS
jgi:hypothetical protein